MADELTGRFPYQSSDLLTQATIKNSDPLPAYHDPQGTEDADKGVPFGMIQADPVAKCTTAAGTPDKVATVSNFRDFVLYNGRKVTVYMQNENGAAATNPTLNVNSTGKFPIRLENQASSVTIGGGCWGAGTLHVFQYVEVDETTKYWLMVGHNVASVTSQYSVLSDSTLVYNKQFIDNDIDYLRLGTNIPNNSNLNTYIDKGVFYCASGSIAQTLQNCPNTSSNFKLIVQINNKDSSGQIWGNQIIYVGGDNRNYIYSRGFNRDSSGSTFSSWQQVATDKNYTTFTIDSGTSNYTLSKQYCYMENGHIHIECYGTFKTTSSAGTTIPLLVIPNAYKPKTTTTLNIGTAIINNSIFPTLAFGKMNGNVYCVYQAITSGINANDLIKFILDYNINA